MKSVTDRKKGLCRRAYRRSCSRRMTALLPALFLLSALLSPLALAENAPLLTSAKRAVVGDADTGEMLWSYNADERAAPASITKMMTLLLAVESYERGEVSLGDTVTASGNAWSDLTDDSSSSGIFEGEAMPFGELLYCAALASANEACNILAEYLAGSITDFVALMNERAAQLGLEGTHFVNTHGLPNDGHYTTAADLFKIACEGMSHELFRELVGTAQHTVPATNASPERELKNSNALITDKAVYGDHYFYEGACGIKTGHTDAAGFCLASCAERNGLRLIAIVLGADADLVNFKHFDNFDDSIAILDWAFANYEHKTFVGEGADLGERRFEACSRTGTVRLSAAEEISATVAAGLKTGGEMRVYDESIIPRVGSAFGEYTVRDDAGELIGKTELIAESVTLDPLPTPTPTPEPTPVPTSEPTGFGLPVSTVALVLLTAVAVLLLLIAVRTKK